MTLAHAGHWYHSLLYLVPVLLIAAALWWSGRGEPGPDADEHEADDLLDGDDAGPGGPGH